MPSKTADPSTTPAPPAPRPPTHGSNAGRSVLGADLRITGEITSTGSVEVMGEIDGNLTAHGLIIGVDGRLTGSVSAATVEVKGKLDGKVSCESLTLRSSAFVKANVTTGGIVIESGAVVDGRFRKPKN